MSNSHVSRFVKKTWVRRKRNMIRADFSAAKRAELVNGFLCSTVNTDRQQASTFKGRKLANGSNTCYLNSTINGLFSLKTFRNFIMADEPVLGLKLALKSILTGAANDAENVRQLLAQEFGHVYDFSHGKQAYIGDALVSLLEGLSLEEVSQYVLEIERRCHLCCYKTKESKAGALHFFTLYEDTKSTYDMLHCDQITELDKCPGCDRGTFCKEKISISDPQKYLLIGCARHLGNEQEVYPTEELTMADGSCYQIKSVINYISGSTVPGQESGHYTTSLYMQNQWFLVNDLHDITQMESPPVSGIVFLYELLEEQTDEEPSTENDPVPFDEQERHDNGEENEEGLEMLSREIGRIPVVAFTSFNREHFHLRNLLHVVKGPKSFEDVRTVDGQVCPTYQAAAVKLGLFEDDTALEQTLEEAFTVKIGRTFRHCFVILLIHGSPSDPLALYEKFQFKLCEDLGPKGQVLAEPTVAMKNQALNELNAMFKKQGFDMVEKFGLPPPTDVDYDLTGEKYEVQQELAYDVEAEAEVADSKKQMLNPGQRIVYDKVLSSVYNDEGRLFFLEAPGGTGKTLTTEAIIAELRSQGHIVIAMATTGIGATLLPGAGTVHSKTKAGVELHEKSMCNYEDNSGTAEVIRKAKLAVIDEATIGPRLLYECLDRSFKNTRGNDRPFGGMTVLFIGNWAQTLPVVPGGGPADVIRQTLKRSYLWSKVLFQLLII